MTWKFKPFFESDFDPELLEAMKAKNMPMPGLIPNQSNNGSVFVYEVDEKGESLNIVCEVRCHTDYPRGQGHKAKCAIRDERATLIAAAPEMFEALEGCIAVWEKWYQKLPREAEDDEFGAILIARAALIKAVPSTGDGE